MGQLQVLTCVSCLLDLVSQLVFHGQAMDVHTDTHIDTHVGIHMDTHVCPYVRPLDALLDVHNGRPEEAAICMPCGQLLPAAPVEIGGMKVQEGLTSGSHRLHPLSAAVPRASIVDIQMDVRVVAQGIYMVVRMDAHMGVHMGVHMDIHSLTM